MAAYEPGDTLDLYIVRNGDRLSVPVVLGEHPTIEIPPDPLWLSQSVDLSAYTGQDVLVRFEYISQPDASDAGMVIDNIAIPEIDYVDDAEAASDWDMHGWERIDNQVKQQFLVQYISSGGGPRAPRVRQLIEADDPAISGEWSFHIGPNELIIFAVSGINEDTHQPAHFDLSISAGLQQPNAQAST